MSDGPSVFTGKCDQYGLDGKGLALTPRLYRKGYAAYKDAVCIPGGVFCGSNVPDDLRDSDGYIYATGPNAPCPIPGAGNGWSSADGDIILENMDNLIYVGESAFFGFSQKLTIRGSFKKWKAIDAFAFANCYSPEKNGCLPNNTTQLADGSSIELNGATALEEVGWGAFDNVRVRLTIVGAFPVWVTTFSDSFQGAFTADSVIKIQCRGEYWLNNLGEINGEHDEAGEECYCHDCSGVCADRCLSTSSSTTALSTTAGCTGPGCKTAPATAVTTTPAITPTQPTRSPAGAIVGSIIPVLLLAGITIFYCHRQNQNLKRTLSHGDAVELLELDGGAASASNENPSHPTAVGSHNFAVTLNQMVKVGRLDALQAQKKKVPVEIERGNFTLVTKIGSGQFGEVWKGMVDTSATTGIPPYMVAVKTVIDAQANPEGLEELVQEATVMAQVGQHPNLVGLVGVHTSTAEKMIVLSYCEHGSLLTLLKESPCSPSTKLRMMSEVATGMAHLAAQRFVHRDLACRNVLVSTGMVCKVADFGLSRVAVQSSNTPSDDDYYRSATGTFPIRWTAPECMKSMKFNESSDVWSFGITMWECFSDGARPYGEKSNMLVMMQVEQGCTLEKPVACSATMYAALTECLAFDPAARPTFAGARARLQALLAGTGAATADSGALVETPTLAATPADYSDSSTASNSASSYAASVGQYAATTAATVGYATSDAGAEYVAKAKAKVAAAASVEEGLPGEIPTGTTESRVPDTGEVTATAEE